MVLKLALLFAVIVMASTELTNEDRFTQFKEKFNKTYSTPEEEQQRFGVFVENAKKIEEHNAKFARGEVSYSQGINQFSDLTPEEWKQRNHGYNPNARRN